MTVTIDHEARRRLAELSRHLASGLITNDEFVNEVRFGKEPALHDVHFYGLWPLYDDLTTHRLKDKWALTAEGRAWVARIILFLRSGMPYRYPIATGLRAIPVMLLSLVTLGWFGKVWLRRQRRGGDESVWPFYSRADYEAALRNPIYLAGAQPPNTSFERTREG
jgi:hypothetical protein